MLTIKILHEHRFVEPNTPGPSDVWQRLFSFLTLKFDQMAKTQAELAQDLRDTNAQLQKAKAEILASTDRLEQAVRDAGNVTPEVEEALAELKSNVQSVDDLNADTTEGDTGNGGGDEQTT